MMSARDRNVRILHFAGHSKTRCGFFWLKSQTFATEYEEIPIERVAKLLKPVTARAGGGGTIECVMLNACETEGMGKKLREIGVGHVICWRSEVEDTTATNFALDFYTCLDQQDPLQATDYTFAFEQAVARMTSMGGAGVYTTAHVALAVHLPSTICRGNMF